jgi:hypothetical protein
MPLQNLRGRIPVRPFLLVVHRSDAGPTRALIADANAVAPRLAGALHQIKVVLIRIDNDGAGSFARWIANMGSPPNRIDISGGAHGGRAAAPTPRPQCSLLLRGTRAVTIPAANKNELGAGEFHRNQILA